MKKKPCPFCGSEKVVIDQSGLNREAYWPLCKTCGIVEYPTEQAAIEAWNRRTDPIKRSKEMNEWISVKEGVPLNGQRVYGYDEFNYNGIEDKYIYGEWNEHKNELIHHSGWKYSLTHWMPTPPPPEKT